MLLILILVATFCFFFYKWLASGFKVWEDRGIAIPVKPYPLIGSLRGDDFKMRCSATTVPLNYNKFSPDHKYFLAFAFHKPIISVVHPDMVREIGIKAADHFIDHWKDDSMNRSHPEINRMLTMLTGDTWKQVRAGLSSAFTTGKMKTVAKTMVKSGKRFQDYIVRTRESSEDGLIEGKELIGKFALSIVGECVYGISNIDAFAEVESEFIKHCKNTTFRLDGSRIFVALGYLFIPKVMSFFNLKVIDPVPFNYLSKAVKQILVQRKETNYRGNDMLQVLLDVQAKQMNEPQKDEPFSDFEKEAELKNIPNNVTMDEETILQTTTLFLVAGFDTVASTLSMVLYYLATNPEVQERLRQEVDDIAEGLEEPDVLAYEDFASMTFMEGCIHETMRIAPAAAALDRKCVKDYRMSDGGFIPKGTYIFLLTIGIMKDPKYFPDPESFNPDRSTPENKAKMTPYTQLGFGVGPRNCIGMRFAMLEMKTCLYYIMRKFNVKPSSKTVVPPEWDDRAVLTTPKGGNWLIYEDR